MSNNQNNLKVGDIILVEQAWEDEAGYYHDEMARVENIEPNGEMKLNFYEATPEVRQFLAGSDGYMANDYQVY